jgi:PAB-dependent poly(A)-specific ribonuclease subunit 2
VPTGWREESVATDSERSFGVPVSVVCFDPLEEVLWAGLANGRLASFLCPDLMVQTCRPLFHSDILEIKCGDIGVMALCETELKLMGRGGGQLGWAHSPRFSGLRTADFMSRHFANVLVAGECEDYFVFDMERSSLVVESRVPWAVSAMEMAPSFVILGGIAGGLVMTDPRTLQISSFFHSTHTGPVTSLARQGNTLLSVGYHRRGSNFVVDPLIRVYDIRSTRQVASFASSMGATSLVSHPTEANQVMTLAASAGYLEVMDLHAHQSVELYALDFGGHWPMSMAMGSAGRCLAFGDTNGCVRLWQREPEGDTQAGQAGEYSPPLVNGDSRPILPVVEDPAPVIMDWESSSLSALPLWCYTGMSAPSHPTTQRLFSDLPESCWPPGAVPPFEILQPSLIESLEMVDWVGYAPNEGDRLPNQVWTMAEHCAAWGVDPLGAKLSTSSHEGGGNGSGSGGNGGGGGGGGDGDILNVPQHNQPDAVDHALSCEAWRSSTDEIRHIPAPYRKLLINFQKYGAEMFNYSTYNRTSFAIGLEGGFRNSYINPMLQLLRYVPGFPAVFQGHICSRDGCMSCEMRFLMDMLTGKNSGAVEAGNFIRAMKALPEVGRLRFIESDVGSIACNYSEMMEGFLRFLLDQLSKDLSATQFNGTGTTPLDALFAWKYSTTTSCSSCNTSTQRDGSSKVIALQFPYACDGSLTFADVLAHTFTQAGKVKSYCDQCSEYKLLSQKKVSDTIPPVMMIIVRPIEAHENKYWMVPNWLPAHLRIARNKESAVGGGFVVSTMTGEDDFVNPEEVYDCVGITSHVSGDVEQLGENGHMVSHVMPAAYASEWFLFNDLVVVPSDFAEASYFQHGGRKPVTVTFVQRSWMTQGGNTAPWEPQSVPIPPSVLGAPPIVPLARLRKLGALSFSPLNVETEFGGHLQDVHFALDAEFVALSAEEWRTMPDGTRIISRPARLALGRVSVVRGEGPAFNEPCIDDFILQTDPVVDFMTRFSGLTAKDLDPQITKHHLTTLKKVYLKLKYLLSMGCKFVGHGLRMDFRTINIHVPRNQIIDTVELYRMPNHRKLSLRFLAAFVLTLDIQSETHDSIEDARTAMLLYEKYKEYEKEGRVNVIIQQLYACGRSCNWEVGDIARFREENNIVV